MSFEYILNKLPTDFIKANISYNLNSLSSEEAKEEYRQYVIKAYQHRFKDNEHLFFNSLYPEIADINERITYTKYDRVIRKGVKCKKCGSENTQSEDKQKGGGDEYIPSRVQCYDCGKSYFA